MSTQLKCLLLALVIATAFTLRCEETMQTSMTETILNEFKQDTKKMFKVWHYLHNKEYDYNTMEGINKYRTFKTNLKKIEEHNRSNASWKMGLNHLSDMTYEEVKQYYNIKDIDTRQFSRNLRRLNKFNLDDYNDEDEIPVAPKNNESVEYNAIDWREKMRPVRNQGSCGSCWAFATQSVLEGQYAIQSGRALQDWFSTQQSVDCDTRNGGCNGGWYNGAFAYFQSAKAEWEKDYPYKAARGTCAYNSSKGITNISGYYTFEKGWDSAELYSQIMSRGPFATALYVDDGFYKYSSGIFESNCPGSVNHAVVIVGYKKASTCEVAHLIVRNSWGEGWGEKGHMRMAINKGDNSCSCEKFAFSAKGFK